MDTQRRLRGHAFLPPRRVLDKAPAAYATENIAAEDKTIIAHYFSGGADYYIAEMWQEPGEVGEPSRWMAFGYARLASHPEGQEWGYLDLGEVHKRVNTEKSWRDIDNAIRLVKVCCRVLRQAH
jgi:hypothetical protein